MENIKYINFKIDDGGIIIEVSYDENMTVENFIKDFLSKYTNYVTLDTKIYTFRHQGKILNLSKFLKIPLKEVIAEKGTVKFFIKEDTHYSGGYWYEKIINIKFIKIYKNINNKNENCEILGLLKLCLLKEVSQKISLDKLKTLSDIIYYIMKILSQGYIENSPYYTKQNIKEVLEKMKGSNIINFANYVDEIIGSYEINKILNFLEKKDLIEMNNIKYLLSKYNDCIILFNKEIEKSKKESIFEFSFISLVIIEREDFEKYEKEREKCPNRVERILYHGSSIEPISCILTGLYRQSIEHRKAINGKGVYFTDLLDYAWYYGGESNRENFKGIPKVGDTFTVIVNSVYYDENGIEQVKNDSRTPGKNQINFAWAGARSERLITPDESKFLGTEYVIYDLDQICPFMSGKLKRVEFCVIWRDNNFSTKPVYNNEFDKIFKAFLKDRLKYINQNANFNIYTFENSEEALKLVNRKKYNKIILISNVGTDLGGKKFIDNARKIIGNDVIVLFLAYNISHLNWIKNYKNALFSKGYKFYEEYLECFNEYNEYNREEKLNELIKKMEDHYNVKFNFDNKYLEYPHFKNEGVYEDLKF